MNEIINPKVRTVSPKESLRLLESQSIKVIDVREDWEVKICKLPNAIVLDPHLLDEIITKWPRNTNILLYCHHGIRSFDAAQFFISKGFDTVYSMSGGIHAWSLEVDSNVPRYSN